MSNRYFNSVWNKKAAGLENYKIIGTKTNVPNAGYKKTGGKSIQGDINEIILQRK